MARQMTPAELKKYLIIGLSLFLALASLLAACIGNSNSPAVDNVSPPSTAMYTDTSESANFEWIYPTDLLNSEEMNLYWQLDNFQFATDENAILSLYVRADKNVYGDFVFDDGQDWLLVMKTSLGNYELFPRQYLQLGKVSVTVYNGWNEVSNKYDITHVLVTETQGASYKIGDLVFDNERKAFRSEVIYDAQNISFMGRSDLLDE